MKFQEIWNKYNWLIVTVLLIYSAYKTFAPPEVKTLVTEKVVSDSKLITSFKGQINYLQTVNKNLQATITKRNQEDKDVDR